MTSRIRTCGSPAMTEVLVTHRGMNESEPQGRNGCSTRVRSPESKRRFDMYPHDFSGFKCASAS